MKRYIKKDRLLAYVPMQNVVYIFILACSTDIYGELTSWAYIYYLVSLPLIFSFANALQLCRLYKIGTVNPLIAPLLMLITPRTWDATIATLGVYITSVLVVMLLTRWVRNKYHPANGGGKIIIYRYLTTF